MTDTQPEFILTRLFDVPLEKMWQAWTDPKWMAKWWGPKGSKVKVSEMDLKPGGTYHFCLQSPGGPEMWGKFTYREIVKPDHLLLVQHFSDAEGGITRHPLSPSWPLKTLSTFSFAPEGGKTKVTVKWVPLDATDTERKTFAEGMESMHNGWGGSLDQLADVLATG